MDDMLNKIIQSADSRMMVIISAADLREFAENVAESVARKHAEATVAEIKELLGDKMKYCTTQEVKDILGIRSSATLSAWARRGYLVPSRVGIRNLYLREEVLAIKKEKAK